MGMSPQVQLNNRYRKVTRLDGKEVSLDADMIRLLIAIDESKELVQIGRELGMTHDLLAATLAKLSAVNLIEPIRKDIPCLDNGFLEALKLNLSRAVGPMAQILHGRCLVRYEAVIRRDPQKPGRRTDRCAGAGNPG